MKGPVGLQNDREFFRLAVTEIAHAPERSGNSFGVDSVDFRSANAPPQIFVDMRIGIVDEHDGMVVGIRIDAALAHNLIGVRPSRSRVDRQLQVVTNRLRLQPPCQRAAGKQADGKERNHAR